MNTNIVKAKKVSIGDIIVYDGNSFNVKYIEYDYDADEANYIIFINDKG